MESGHLARRLRRLPRRQILSRAVPVADDRRARLLGLALLPRARAGNGLLIPRCSSVHTFGMRFALDLYFLSADGAPIEVRRGVPARRLVRRRGAAAVLEVPAGGRGRRPGPLSPRASREERDRDDRRL